MLKLDKVFNIGIIGAGMVAERTIKACKIHPLANIKGIYDNNPARLEEVAEKYSLSTVNNYNELLEDKEIDIIYLAVPPKFHYPIAMDILKTDKNFICEKPLANSTKEARGMSEIAMKKDIIHSMNFPTIYREVYGKLNDLLNSNFIGDLIKIELHCYFPHWPRLWQQNNWVNSREQGGFTREVITHYIQLIQRLFGEIEDVESFIEYPDNEEIAETSIIGKGKVKGIPLLINAIRDVGMEEEISFRILGNKGVIYLNNWRELLVGEKDKPLERIDLKEESSAVNLLDNVFKAIERKEANIVNFNEGYKTHIIIEELLGNNY